MTNRLAREHSPYLQQHAENPVDWYPWGEEALERARSEDRPIFLSIGYSACHWCHVMAHESFESPQVAALLNSRFVSIKVDREERPDLDRIYMGAVQALTGSGGWPMSVFLTPEGHPFYGGTYFPPEPRHGLPGFTHLLSQIADAWSTRREEITRAGNELVDDLLRRSGRLRAASIAGEQALNTAIQHLIETHDDRWGGWGSGPKFPQPMALEFLLRTFRATGDPNVLGIINAALEAMARGGIYDQIGGGFHRYTVDGRWLIPHFEKMLYDNAQLANVYVHAWQVTGRPLYRAVAEETLNYLAREMRLPAGGYASTQDADTEGVEGDTYLWMPAEIQSVLGEDAARFAASYPTTREGNYEGRNILTYSGQEGEREALADRRAALLAHRAQRSQPRRDGKVICSWNGLLLAALAEAGVALGESAYIASAQSLGAFLTEQMRAAGATPQTIVLEPEGRNTAPAVAVAASSSVSSRVSRRSSAGLSPIRSVASSLAESGRGSPNESSASRRIASSACDACGPCAVTTSSSPSPTPSVATPVRLRALTGPRPSVPFATVTTASYSAAVRTSSAAGRAWMPSGVRTVSRIVSPLGARAWSPAGWPKLSFTHFRSSRSI